MKKRNLAVIFLSLVLFSCTSTRVEVTEAPIVVKTEQLPEGVARYVWDEPMVDVIDVPPGLDPEGMYYRPAHQATVEIRQGRWQYYKGPEGEPQ